MVQSLLPKDGEQMALIQMVLQRFPEVLPTQAVFQREVLGPVPPVGKERIVVREM